MMNISKYLIALSGLMLVSVSVSGQMLAPNIQGEITPLMNIPSPNSSDLGKYGNTPVSYYTGNPNISIPIHTLSVRGLDLPIYLHYDASGVQVNKLPGWTGHNWVLEAGGVITRNVQGAYDEYVPVHQSTVMPFDNYFHSYTKLKEEINNQTLLLSHVEYNRYDYSPDIFTFSFLGKTGRFFLGNDGQWRVQSDENFDIVFNVNDESNYIRPFIEDYPPEASGKQPKVIKGFTLRDSNGYVYEFGGSNDAIEYTRDFFRQGIFEGIESFHANSWFLTRIKDKHENVLYEFEYTRGKFIAQFYNVANSRHNKEYTHHYGLSTGNENSVNNFLFPYGGTLDSPVYLSHILGADGINVDFISSDFPLSTRQLYPNLNIYQAFSDYDYSNIEFFYYLRTDDSQVVPYQYSDSQSNKYGFPLDATRLRKLDGLVLKRLTNPIRYIDFYYDYNSRMHLTEVAFRGKSINKDMSYEMSYNSYGMLPANYLTRMTDHWGYYNGRDYQNNAQSAASQREPSTVCSQYGMLSELIYPTRGKTVFQYEQNQYASYMADDRKTIVSEPGVAGGLRIKTIKDYLSVDATMPIRTRAYTYINPSTGTSSGELFSRPRYSWENWMANTLNDGNAEVKQTIFRSSSIIPLANYFGPHIGYSYVEEHDEDGTFTRYHFKNISSAKDDRFLMDFSYHEPSPFDMFTERGYMRGKPLSVEKYDTTGQPLQRIAYVYRTDNCETDSVLTSNLSYVNSGFSASFSYFTGGIYKVLFPKYDIVRDTLTVFYGNNNVTDVTTYNREDYLLNLTYGYSHQVPVRQLVSVQTQRGADTWCDEFSYFHNTDIGIQDYYWRKSFDLYPTLYTKRHNGNYVNTFKMLFRVEDGRILPDVYLRYNHDNSLDTLVNYLSYTPTGALREFKERGKPKTTLGWSVDETHPYGYAVGETSDLEHLFYNDGSNPHAHVTIRSYSALDHGLNLYRTPFGYSIRYTYDQQGRLNYIYDEDLYTLKHFEYNYKE